jgi:surface antigen
MKSIFATVAAALMLTACTTAERAAGVGALAGGTIAGVATGSPGAALAGATVGAVAGGLLGRAASNPGQCVYQRADGRQFYAECPANYRY